MDPSKMGESSTLPKQDRRASAAQSSAAFIHHLHTDPKSHHITLSAGLARQPSAPPTARPSQPEVDTAAPGLTPPESVVRKSSKRSRPRTAPSRPREKEGEPDKPGVEQDLIEAQDSSCVVDFMREDEMTDAMDMLSVSGTSRGNSGTLLVGRAGHANPKEPPLLSPPAREIERTSPEHDTEQIGWRDFGKNYAAGNFDPLHIPRPPVFTISEPINSASSSPGLRYRSLERPVTSSDTNSSGGSMATASTGPSTAPSFTAPGLVPSYSAEAILTNKGMGKARSMEAESLIQRHVKPTKMAIPSYDIAAATVRIASASSGYGPDSFAPLGVPSPDQELTDPMAGLMSTSTTTKTGNSDPSHGSRFPLSRSMSSAVEPDRRMLQLPTINASPASTPNEHPRSKLGNSPLWHNGGSLRPHIPAATAPVEKAIEVESNEDYFGDAVSPPHDMISRQPSYAASTDSSNNTVTAAPTPIRRAKTPPPRLDELLDESPPRMSK